MRTSPPVNLGNQTEVTLLKLAEMIRSIVAATFPSVTDHGRSTIRRSVVPMLRSRVRRSGGSQGSRSARTRADDRLGTYRLDVAFYRAPGA
jgi:hypothetical protein